MSVDSNPEVGTAAEQEILCKGVSLLHFHDFVRSRFGDDAWGEVLYRLKPGAREIFTRPVLASGWYPYTTYVEAVKIVVECFLGGDIQRAREIGAYNLESSLNTIYRALYKVGSPAFLMRMSATLWRSYFNVGRMVVEKAGRGFAIARIENFVPPAEVCCWHIIGSMVRSLEFSGASSVKPVHTDCPLKGDLFMRYEARWIEGE